ncbi:MAG TPA: hypothetical protein VI749_04075 [Candidatus Omnitrophota bacterium]|nr:hypothetical protein [Candidatus Omnitrophota bacterium]
MRKGLLMVIFLGLFVQQAFGEVMILKNGRRLEGKLVAKTDGFVTLDVGGVNHTYRTDEISYVGEAAPVEEPSAPVLELIEPAASVTEPALVEPIIVEEPVAAETQADVEGTIVLSDEQVVEPAVEPTVEPAVEQVVEPTVEPAQPAEEALVEAPEAALEENLEGTSDEILEETPEEKSEETETAAEDVSE